MPQCHAFHIMVATIGVNERCVLEPGHCDRHRYVSSMPPIVCLCGSTRFKEEFQSANMEETLAGRIVLSVGAYMHADNLLLEPEKRALDLLHFRKIDLATEVYFLNVGGYMGKSTTRELAYTIFIDKRIRWLDPIKGEEFMQVNSHPMGQLIAAFMNGEELPEFPPGMEFKQV